MKIVADESIERPVVARLRIEGHQVIHIAEIAPGIIDWKYWNMQIETMPC